MATDEELTAALDRISVLEAEIVDLENEINSYVCDECIARDNDDTRAPVEAVGSWLERQSVLGFISPEGKKVVEQLLADL